MTDGFVGGGCLHVSWRKNSNTDYLDKEIVWQVIDWRLCLVIILSILNGIRFTIENTEE